MSVFFGEFYMWSFRVLPVSAWVNLPKVWLWVWSGLNFTYAPWAAAIRQDSEWLDTSFIQLNEKKNQMSVMLFSGQSSGWKTLSKIIDIRMSKEIFFRRQILFLLAHFGRQSDGFHDICWTDGCLSPGTFRHTFFFRLRTDVVNIGRLCARAAHPCLGGVRPRCWRFFFFSPEEARGWESIETYGLAFGHCATLLDREDFFFLNPVGICFLLMNTTAKWLAQIKPTDRVCLDLLIKKLEMQDARFC